MFQKRETLNLNVAFLSSMNTELFHKWSSLCNVNEKLEKIYFLIEMHVEADH